MEQLFRTVLDVSISASVLCVLILCARLIIGRKPTAMLTLLGALLIARLAIPVMIPSPISAMNLFSGITAGQAEETETVVKLPSVSYDMPVTQYSAPEPAAYTDNAIEAEPVNAPAEHTAIDTEPVSASMERTAAADTERVNKLAPLSAMEIASIVWLSGIAVLAACIAFSNVRFSRLLKKNRPYSAPGFDELLAECKNELGIKKDIVTVQLSCINTAAVYGYFRPRLLISPSFGWLTREDKRYVLLHELAHIKRRDTLACLLITALNVVYWFNPLVWAAFTLMRGDMEVMCDAAVLENTGDRKGYAATLINLAQSGRSPRPRLVTALFMRHSFNGLFISTDSIKRRIKMITRYKKNSALYTAIALILVIAIAAVGCTGPAAATLSPEATAPASNTSESPESTAAAMPLEIEGKEIVGWYALDFSAVAGDEARVSNIKKAAETMDGKVFPHWDKSLTEAENIKREIHLPDAFGPITEEAGWKNAAWSGWGKTIFCIQQFNDTNGNFKSIEDKVIWVDAPEMQIGGGLEIAATAFINASKNAGLSCEAGFAGSDESKYPDPPYEDRIDNGSMGAANDYTSDLTLSMRVDGNVVTAAFYSDGPVETAVSQVSGGTYTLKDNSLSISAPEGWAAKDTANNSGFLYNRDLGIDISIQSYEIGSCPYTPRSMIEDESITVRGADGMLVQKGIEIISERSATVGGMQGSVLETRASLDNGEERRRADAFFVDTYKYYFISYSTDNNEDFDKYKPMFYDMLDTLNFEPNDWRTKFSDKFTDGAVEQTDNSYKSADINVSINKAKENGATYYVADIYVAKPKYFKTAFPGTPENMGDREPTDAIAKAKNAIIAINGDHCIDNRGPVVRNGVSYRSEKAGDVLVMNYDGSMKAYSADELDLTKIETEGAYQVWTFGPMLLHDGQPMTEFNSPENINGKNPRTAVGYYEPGHYCFVVVDGRQPGYSDGMDMAQLSQLMADLGCKEAFNLDGGQTSEMAFMGKIVNQPYNGGRSTTDILYVGEE